MGARSCLVGCALLLLSRPVGADELAVPASFVAIAPGARTPSPAEARAFAIGARFSSPGRRCQLGAEALADEVIATEAGPTTLRCTGDDAPPVEVPLVITPVIVDAAPAPVRRGTRARIHVTVASTATIGDRLEVEAIGDLALGEIVRSDGGLDVEIVAARAGAPEAALAIRAGTVELGRVRIPLVDAPPEIPAVVRSAWFALDLGVYIGALTAPSVGGDVLLVGRPRDPDDALTSGPLAGVRVGLFPTRRVGLELETAFATPSYVGRLGVAGMIVSRLSIAARVVEDGRFGLRTVIGGDVLALVTEAGTSRPGVSGGVHYGAAFSVETRRNVSVRLQGLHVVSVARDGAYAHCIEVGIGVVARLGRRDRWN